MDRLSRKTPLLQLQRQIHENLLRESENLLGKPTGILRRYERAYHRALAPKLRRAKEAPKSEFLDSIDECSIVLMGDYHHYHQSQRAALRLLKVLRARYPNRPLVLGLEIFSTDFQSTLDRYLAGKITEETLLRRSLFNEKWGFSWQHFEALLKFAKLEGIRILALNRPGGVLPSVAVMRKAKADGDLGARDEWAAAIMLDDQRAQPDALILALYGEYHLAPNHLPARLVELAARNRWARPETLIVYQNIDELYWQIRKKKNLPRSNLFRLGAREYCHFSGTPWTKLQALVNWVNGDPALFSDEELDTRSEFLTWMMNYGEIIAQFFGLEVPSFAEVDVYGLHPDLGLPKMPRTHARPLVELLQAQERIYERWRNQSWVYTPSLSENSAGELTSVHLRHGHQSAFLPLKLDSVNDVAERVIDHLVGFMGSLLINPRRKCDQLSDQKQLLKRMRGDQLFPGERIVRMETVRFMELCFESTPLGRRRLRAEIEKTMGRLKTPRLRFGFARFLGHWLGHWVHDEMLIGAVPFEQVAGLFQPRNPLQQLELAMDWMRTSPRDVQARTRHETL